MMTKTRSSRRRGPEGSLVAMRTHRLRLRPALGLPLAVVATLHVSLAVMAAFPERAAAETSDPPPEPARAPPAVVYVKVVVEGVPVMTKVPL